MKRLKKIGNQAIIAKINSLGVASVEVLDLV